MPTTGLQFHSRGFSGSRLITQFIRIRQHDALAAASPHGGHWLLALALPISTSYGLRFIHDAVRVAVGLRLNGCCRCGSPADTRGLRVKSTKQGYQELRSYERRYSMIPD